MQERLAALGFGERDAAVLAEHFLDAEARGKQGHGLARVNWLETLPETVERTRVTAEIARVIDAERQDMDFSLSVKATLVVGRKAS